MVTGVTQRTKDSGHYPRFFMDWGVWDGWSGIFGLLNWDNGYPVPVAAYPGGTPVGWNVPAPQ